LHSFQDAPTVDLKAKEKEIEAKLEKGKTIFIFFANNIAT
jgi:hypothetical protein